MDSIFRSTEPTAAALPQLRPTAHVQAAPTAASAEPNATPFRQFLEQLAERVDVGERQTQRALAPGPGLDAVQLLSLQTATYRYTEAVDLAAKLVDKASGAVKTVLQGQ